MVLESVRDRHMINILEEGTTELAALKTKRFLTENLNIINKILVEEGVVDGARNHLANNWGKYAAAGTVGGAVAADQLANGGAITDQVVDGAKNLVNGSQVQAGPTVGQDPIAPAPVADPVAKTQENLFTPNGAAGLTPQMPQVQVPAPTATVTQEPALQRI